MSATNSTTNYNLPIFIASDSPKWLVDWNGAMNTIDSAINTVATAASGAAGDITTLQSDLQTLSGTVTTQGTSISTLTSSLSSLTGTVNTITSLIGNGEPTTTDKTIIGAINELHSDIQQIVVSVDAEDISYDNTTSGLLATNVQTAIDEVVNDINSIRPTTASRRVIVVADSYGTAASATNFVKKLESKLNLGSGNFYNISINSMGFCAQGGNDNDTALTALQAQAGNISSPSTITDIIVTVGINDTNSNYMSSIESAVTAFINYCKTTYPNAKLHYGFAGNQSGADATTYDVLTRYYKLIPLLYNQFRAAGCHVIKGIENVLHDARNLGADWLHPNATGAEALAEFVFEYLRDGEAHYRAYEEFTNTDGAQLLISIDDDVTMVKCAVGSGQSSGTITSEMNLINTAGSAIRGIKAINYYFQYYLIVSGAYTPALACYRESRMKVYTTGLSGSYTGTSQVTVTLPTINI